MYRAAIIGCGWIGGGGEINGDQPYTHAGAYQVHDEVSLVAGCDVNEGRLRHFGEKWRVVNLYNDFSAFLSHEQVDFLSVCTWDSSHAEIVREVVEARAAKAIICEKPLATSSAAAREIVDLCRRHGISLYVNYQRRWDPDHQAVGRWIAEGACGNIRTIHGYYVRGLFHNGVTWINLLQMLVGNVTRVRAMGAEFSELDGDPTLSASFELENGATATMWGMRRSDYSIFEMDILGSAGRVVLSDNGRDIRRYQVQDDKDYPGFRRLGLVHRIDAQHSVLALIQLIREAVLDLKMGRHAFSTGQDAVRDLEIAELIRQSAACQGAILPLEDASDVSRK